ncbi:hypothetical protein FHG87_017550 [Trinorchestia longiramus]|nr:hypothetical protein FHG87_017550 [Trinorchestia longiramus]
MWVTNLEDLSLRGNDIHSLVQRARQHSSTDRALWHSPLLPVSRPATKMLLRLLIAVRKKANNRMCVLVSDKTSTHLPTTEISPVRSLHYTLKKYMTEIFGAELPPHQYEHTHTLMRVKRILNTRVTLLSLHWRAPQTLLCKKEGGKQTLGRAENFEN